MTAPSVLLLSMPFASVELPNLSVALLQGHFQRAGYRCDAHYANLELAARLDEDIRLLAGGGPLAGEWLFVPALYGQPIIDDDVERYQAFARGVLGPAFSDDLAHRLVEARPVATAYIDELADRIDWTSYDVIGFSTVFQQTLASLALATRIKARHPELPILFGGASVHDDMGLAVHERFACVDFVCTGEADTILFDLVDAALGRVDPAVVPGIVHRVGDRSVANPPAPPVDDLDGLPYPVYDDWFAKQSEVGLDDQVRSIMVETSRGCWWGAISHCTFCGLNGDSMRFRAKSADRAYDEIVGLHQRYEAEFVTIADNILDMRYLRTLLPRLAELEPTIPLFFEIRPKMKRSQVALLAQAGARSVLPGIESLSDRALELMGKATTGLEGIKLLKHGAEYGLSIEWSYLYGTPGETAEDHRRAEELIQLSRHLPPPLRASRVQVHRFAPLHERAQELGLTNVRAESVYQLLFPFDQETLDRIAYVFDADYQDGFDEALDADGVIALVEEWITGSGQGGLWETDAEDGSLWLVDERPWIADPRSVRLVGWKAEVYRRCDGIADEAELVEVAAAAGITAERLRTFLGWCRSRHYLASDASRYLGLAVHHPPRWPALPSPRRPTIPVSTS